MVFRAPAGRVGAGGQRPHVDAQLGVAGDQTPAIGDAIVDCELSTVGLGILSIADHDRESRWWVGLLQAAESVVAVVERRQGEGDGPALMAVSKLVGELLFGVEVRAAGEEEGRLARSVELPVNARWCPERSRNSRPKSPDVA